MFTDSLWVIIKNEIKKYLPETRSRIREFNEVTLHESLC
jgi:hypothetical protein